MDTKEILKYCVERGLLLDPEVLKIFSETADEDSVKLIIEKIGSYTQKKIITKELFEKNKEQVVDFFLRLPKENQEKLERLKIKLGLQIEISKESSVISSSSSPISFSVEEDPEESQVIVLSKTPSYRKKIEVDDFVKNLRSRFQDIKEMLQEHPELEGLVSINKLSKTRQKISIIGIVSEKRTTKNKNILLDAEDFTGKIRILINQNKPELYKKAEELSLDSVVGFTGFGDREIFFANNIVFPEAMVHERKKSPVEESAVFLSDIHYGSKFFMEQGFIKFIDYLNGKHGNSSESEKIKYLFMVGDLVSGIGVYPGQKKDLKIEDLEAQFQGLAELLSKIRRGIKIIISPGNHDGVRLMEPQPILDEKYAWPLYNMKNIILTGNPSYVNIAARKNFSGFDVLTYHGFSYPFYANTVPSLVEKSLNEPDKIMAYLLKNRHLAPTYSSVQNYPAEKDDLVIKKIPDIFVSGHTHKCAVSHYNNILVISGSGWEEETEYQKRKGNQPDFCKVPLLNLKTRALKILDFDVKDEHAKLLQAN
ncbi:MAG: metallophosphoesterase [Nanoarchaeota archaeon]|nr:metallophosphoesterase [Nanoarchaeota archaeon]